MCGSDIKISRIADSLRNLSQVTFMWATPTSYLILYAVLPAALRAATSWIGLLGVDDRDIGGFHREYLASEYYLQSVRHELLPPGNFSRLLVSMAPTPTVVRAALRFYHTAVTAALQVAGCGQGCSDSQAWAAQITAIPGTATTTPTIELAAYTDAADSSSSEDNTTAYPSAIAELPSPTQVFTDIPDVPASTILPHDEKDCITAMSSTRYVRFNKLAEVCFTRLEPVLLPDDCYASRTNLRLDWIRGNFTGRLWDNRADVFGPVNLALYELLSEVEYHRSSNPSPDERLWTGILRQTQMRLAIVFSAPWSVVGRHWDSFVVVNKHVLSTLAIAAKASQSEPEEPVVASHWLRFYTSYIASPKSTPAVTPTGLPPNPIPAAAGWVAAWIPPVPRVLTDRWRGTTTTLSPTTELPPPTEREVQRAVYVNGIIGQIVQRVLNMELSTSEESFQRRLADLIVLILSKYSSVLVVGRLPGVDVESVITGLRAMLILLAEPASRDDWGVDGLEALRQGLMAQQIPTY